MAVSPLEVAYRAVSKGYEDGFSPLTSEKRDFSFAFYFPLPKNSTHPPYSYETSVVWDEEKKFLLVSTILQGVIFGPWERMCGFFSELNETIRPFLEGDWEMSGGKITPFCLDEQNLHKLLPAYQGCLVCENLTEKRIARLFLEVVESSAYILLLSLPVFEFIVEHGREPDAAERMRLLSLGFGQYEIHRKVTCRAARRVVLLPPRLFGGMGISPPQ